CSPLRLLSCNRCTTALHAGPSLGELRRISLCECALVARTDSECNHVRRGRVPCVPRCRPGRARRMCCLTTVILPPAVSRIAGGGFGYPPGPSWGGGIGPPLRTPAGRTTPKKP